MKIQNLLVENEKTAVDLANGTTINVEDIPAWNDLTTDQQYFIICYVENFPSNAIACVRSNVTRSTFTKWRNEFGPFNDVYDLIKDLHVEGLLTKEYTDSIANSKIRGRVLMALNAPGYEKKGTTNNHLHVDKDMFSALLESKKENE